MDRVFKLLYIQRQVSHCWKVKEPSSRQKIWVRH